MKQASPARLTQPLLRKPGSERGAGEFEPISWERAFEILEDAAGEDPRQRPRKFAFFTGRDQMQALTGLFARQFGTPNYAAHGGFCSVNMAAGMIYTIGGSFWEFGGPDLDRAKLFVMIGTAEDHHSNPLKIALGKFKRGGGRFISINPVRTGYSAIADEWIPIRPGTDGALFMALLHELIASDLVDHAFLKRFTNAPQLVVLDAGEREGMFAHDPDPAKGPPGDGRHPHNKLVYDTASRTIKAAYPEGIAEGSDPALEGVYALADGTRVAPSFQLLRDRVAPCTPEWARGDHRHRRRAHPEARARARRDGAAAGVRAADRLDRRLGQAHETTQARPVAFHAMRGLAAHSNGFQTVRALAVLMSVLGTIDAPGGFRHKAPYPRHIVPNYRAFNSPDMIQPNTPLNAAPLGFPANPDELAIGRRRLADADRPRVLVGAPALGPRPDAHRHHQRDARRPVPHRHADDLHGQHGVELDHEHGWPCARCSTARTPTASTMIPFLVVCDAFQSETVAFADLVLPDTTYLERHDVMSMLDRPISEFDGPVDSVRVPVVPPTRPVQAVPGGADRARVAPQVSGLHDGRRQPQVQGLSGLRRQLRAPAGHRLPDGLARQGRRRAPARRAEPEAVGDVREERLRVPVPHARDDALHAQLEPRVPRLREGQGLAPEERSGAARALFRHAAELSPRRAGQDAGRQPPEHLRERIATYFDPLPFWYAPLEDAATDLEAYPLNAITQRPMAQYHSWDSQNAWLRQIHSHNYLHVNPLTAEAPASPTAAGAGSRASGARCAA